MTIGFLLQRLAEPGCRRSGCRAGLLLLALGLAPMPAAAVATYSYTGNPFTDALSAPVPNAIFEPYTTSSYISATVMLDSALPANLALTDVSGLAGFELVLFDQSFFGPRSHDDSVVESFTARLATDAAGSISRWHLRINIGSLQDGSLHNLQTLNFIESGNAIVTDGALAFVSTLGTGSGSNQGSPGTWSCRGTCTPTAATAMPEPTGVLTLAASLLMLGGLVRRRA